MTFFLEPVPHDYFYIILYITCFKETDIDRNQAGILLVFWRIHASQDQKYPNICFAEVEN